ncbi:MAG TPA: hypothetical protein DIS90_16860 [Cytophagales bacterium]|nr:hypothetical protein [Cytophagales bacterium]HCR55263.1 hypothetical protein [Cytophagales bacterium]
MKGWIGVIALSMALLSCQESETVSEFTGNEVTYALQQTSDFKVSGTVTIKEKKDGTSLVLLQLEGTDGDMKLPVHLHLGDISAPDAEIAALLNPVVASTGISETSLTQLANETKLSYNELIDLEASIKIHLSDVGPERDIILAGGNIGAIASKGIANGRVGIGVCKSE